MLKKTVFLLSLVSCGALCAMDRQKRSETGSVTETITIDQQLKDLEQVAQEFARYITQPLSSDDARKFSDILGTTITPACDCNDTYEQLILAHSAKMLAVSAAYKGLVRTQQPKVESVVSAFSGSGQRSGTFAEEVGKLRKKCAGLETQCAGLGTIRDQLQKDVAEKARQLTSTQNTLTRLGARFAALTSVNARMCVQVTNDAQVRAELEATIAELQTTCSAQRTALEAAQKQLTEVDSALTK